MSTVQVLPDETIECFRDQHGIFVREAFAHRFVLIIVMLSTDQDRFRRVDHSRHKTTVIGLRTTNDNKF